MKEVTNENSLDELASSLKLDNHPSPTKVCLDE